MSIPSKIQLNIFGFLSSQDLAVVARVCQAWTDAAIDVLWGEEPISIWMIVRLLVEAPVGQTRRQNTRSHWHRVARLTRNVKTLTGRREERPEGFSVLPIIELQQLTPDISLFPRLLITDVNVTEATREVLADNLGILRALSVFFPPSLRAIRLSVDEWMSTSVLWPLLQQLAGNLPNLVHFSLKRCRWWDNHNLPCTKIIPFLRSLPSLQEIELPESMELVLPAVSQLHGIVELSVALKTGQGVELRNRPFSDLRGLTVTSEDHFGPASDLLRYIPVAQLTSVTIEHCPPTKREGRPFSTLAKSLIRHFTSLTMLELYSQESDGTPWFHTGKQLVALKPLVNLEHLVVSLYGRQLDIGEEEVDKMTKDMKALRSLDLNGASDSSPFMEPTDAPTLTRHTLYVLARNCPMLEELQIRLDFAMGFETQEVVAEGLRWKERLARLRLLNVVQSEIVSSDYDEHRPCDMKDVLSATAIAIAILTPPDLAINTYDPRGDEAKEEERRFWRKLPKVVTAKREGLVSSKAQGLDITLVGGGVVAAWH